MDSRPDPVSTRATLEVLAKNAALLATLREEAAGRSDVADRLGVSGKTVYRRVRKLSERGLVERGDEYRLTTVGRLYADVLRRVETILARVEAGRDILSSVPAENVPPAWLFAESEPNYFRPHAERHPTQVLERFVRTAETVRGLAPVVFPNHVDAFYRGPAGTSGELVVEPSVLAYLREESTVADPTGAGLAVRETDASLPFGLLVTDAPDPRMLVVLYDHSWRPACLLSSEAATAVAWADGVFRQYSAGATPAD